MKVKYLDLQKQFNNRIFFNAIKEEIRLCKFILGPEEKKFESDFAKLCGTSFALGLNSGTDAIFLALKALGVGPGDEVITVPNSFVATVGAIIAADAKPVFVDTGPDYNIDVTLIKGAITKHTKAILPVHLTGNPADMDTIIGIARKHNLFVIEDAAQAVTASINGRHVGSFGDAGCFSLHPLKNLNVCGDGGVLTTNSPKVYQKIKLLRNHGLKSRDEIECFGYNSRLDTIQAAIARRVMKILPSVTKKRIKNAKLYNSLLKEIRGVILPPKKKNYLHVYHTYTIQVDDREKLIEYLSRNGVETKIHYPIPIHLQKPCKQLGYKKGDFPVCEKQVKRILSLPVHQHLTDEQIHFVIHLIKEFYESN